MGNQYNFEELFIRNLEDARVALENTEYLVEGFLVHVTEYNDLQYTNDDPGKALEQLFLDLYDYPNIDVQLSGSAIVEAIRNEDEDLDVIMDDIYGLVRGEVIIQVPSEQDRKPVQIEYVPSTTGGKFDVMFFTGHQKDWQEEIIDALEAIDAPLDYEMS